MKKFFLYSAFIIIIVSGTGWAGNSPSQSPGFSGEVFWQSISFFLFIILLVKFLKKPVKASLEKRREEIKASFDQLIQREKEAEAEIEAWERKLNSLNQEIALMHQRIIAEGEAEGKRIITHALEEGENIKKQAQIVAEQEYKKALKALKKETVDLAITMAQDLLKKVIQEKDQERLIKEFIGQMGVNP